VPIKIVRNVLETAEETHQATHQNGQPSTLLDRMKEEFHSNRGLREALALILSPEIPPELAECWDGEEWDQRGVERFVEATRWRAHSRYSKHINEPETLVRIRQQGRKEHADRMRRLHGQEKVTVGQICEKANVDERDFRLYMRAERHAPDSVIAKRIDAVLFSDDPLPPKTGKR
jgi:hypothetical protein